MFFSASLTESEEPLAHGGEGNCKLGNQKLETKNWGKA